MLAAVVRRLPGLRVPGAFDGFELAVRAVLGQQVSVKSATTHGRPLGARLRRRPSRRPMPELNLLAPTRRTHGRRHRRARSRRSAWSARGRDASMALAHAAAERRIVLGLAADVEEQIERLTALPGIGPWTAQYIAMRALRWPDAFPAEDLMVLRAAGTRQEGIAGAGGRLAAVARLRHPLSMAIARSRTMIYYSQTDSPIGLLILKSDGEALTGIYMTGTYLDAPSRPPRDLDRWVLDPSCEPLPEDRAAARGVLHRETARLRLAAAPRGHGISTARVAQLDRRSATAKPVSYGEQARRIGNANASRAVGLANGKQSHPDRGALSSGDRRERLAHRISAEGSIASAGCSRTSGAARATGSP